jgi:hypothetical protein
MHMFYKKVEIIQIRNIKTKTKGKHMQIQIRKSTQNPSTIPPDPEVEREEKGRNALTPINNSIQNLHVSRNR